VLRKIKSNEAMSMTIGLILLWLILLHTLYTPLITCETSQNMHHSTSHHTSHIPPPGGSTDEVEANTSRRGPFTAPAMVKQKTMITKELMEDKPELLSKSVTRLSRIFFLYDAYEGQYWYWEVVESSRRLLLTAVLSVCAPGSSGQMVLAILMCQVGVKCCCCLCVGVLW
jgi:hypothetical protein